MDGEAYVFVLAWPLIGDVIVTQGQVKARIAQLITAKLQQPGNIVFSLPYVIQIQPNVLRATSTCTCQGMDKCHLNICNQSSEQIDRVMGKHFGANLKFTYLAFRLQ
jgi:hypothetical protein